MKARKEKTKVFYVKAYMKKELIQELGLASDYEFKKIVTPHKERIGERIGNYYTPKQVRTIIELVQTYKKSKTKTNNHV